MRIIKSALAVFLCLMLNLFRSGEANRILFLYSGGAVYPKRCFQLYHGRVQSFDRYAAWRFDRIAWIIGHSKYRDQGNGGTALSVYIGHDRRCDLYDLADQTGAGFLFCLCGIFKHLRFARLR